MAVADILLVTRVDEEGPCQHTTTSERIDELPWLIYWLKQMQVDVIIDRVLGPPHGN